MVIAEGRGDCGWGVNARMLDAICLTELSDGRNMGLFYATYRKLEPIHQWRPSPPTLLRWCRLLDWELFGRWQF